MELLHLVHQLRLLYLQPGSRNSKADALSRQFRQEPAGTSMAEPILPPARIIGMVTWEVEDQIWAALCSNRGPRCRPPNKLFVPRELRPKCLTGGTPAFFPAIRDSSAHSPSSLGGSVGRLWLWTPVSLLPLAQNALATSLPTDRRRAFCAPYLCPAVPGPTSRRTSSLDSPYPETPLFFRVNVVKQHGIPMDTVSDRGPQFTSRVWQTFCKGIGSMVNFKSGYHPQISGQAERTNQCVETMVRCVAAHQPAS
ncbi:uncharacterized protein LOC133558437 [Nerophis ophidion]|uniref:uncharacterized protein LOC133558437 n=1 Tax=Nerophis ophidion TaxID=159077 RepID=UPI002ADF2A11|nr:uncharacterized protein LOC133558437 [Nerophis ophidion]